MLDSTSLRAFASFAEDANLSRAAKRLHLSQPAVHAQIRRLSEALGVELYRRAGRGLSLTPEGIEVAAFARSYQASSDALAARLRGDAADPVLVVAAGAGAILYVAEEGLRAFVARGAARLEIARLDAVEAVRAVKDGSAQVGIAALATDPEGFEARTMTTVEQVLVMPRAHQLSRRRRLSLEDLEGERLVAPPAGRPHRLALDAELTRRHVACRVAATAVGWELTLKLVELGAGVAVVNACCAIPRTLVAKRVRELAPVRYLAFARRDARADATSLVRTLAEHGDAWRTRRA